ncbi:MAG: dihydrodipicolinate reductase C-terminal domain-containing protein [Rhodothermales bacterium]|nr:dihydrodipicolinate reductase C-terminal domain-containing protein [Rhodothermales bacterium]
MKLAIVGNGKMGQALIACAKEAEHEIACTLDSQSNAGGAGITAESMSGVDVALEFTTPDAVWHNIERLIALRIPTVVGTTGWHDRIPEVRRMVSERKAALVYGANFAPGLQVFLRITSEAARAFSHLSDFDAFIVEHHHQFKRDAPSGTARVLRDVLRSADSRREFPISSVRGGHIPGTHSLMYDSADETVTVTHRVRNRRVFAVGALLAAEWIRDRTGCYSFEDVVLGNAPAD